jgi:hypothetical protein
MALGGRLSCSYRAHAHASALEQPQPTLSSCTDRPQLEGVRYVAADCCGSYGTAPRRGPRQLQHHRRLEALDIRRDRDSARKPDPADNARQACQGAGAAHRGKKSFPPSFTSTDSLRRERSSYSTASSPPEPTRSRSHPCPSPLRPPTPQTPSPATRN